MIYQLGNDSLELSKLEYISEIFYDELKNSYLFYYYTNEKLQYSIGNIDRTFTDKLRTDLINAWRKNIKEK